MLFITMRTKPLLASLLLAGENEETRICNYGRRFAFCCCRVTKTKSQTTRRSMRFWRRLSLTFEAVEDRPITYQVVLDDDPEVAAEVQSFMNYDLAVAAAFVERAKS